MMNMLEKMMGAVDTRRFIYEGKVYTSFTPHMSGDINRYQNVDAYCCDIEAWPVFMSNHRMRYGREHYILSVLAQLLYNNQHITSYEELAILFNKWIYKWRGNDQLGTPEEVAATVESYRDTIISAVDVKDLILSSRIKSHWYPLSVELETNAARRAELKRKVRAQERASMIREEIRSESNNFRNTWWNILPTAKHMSICTSNSLSTVHKYGAEFCISKSEFTENIVRTLRERYPDLSQTQFIDTVRVNEGIELSLSTVKRYWTPEKALP